MSRSHFGSSHFGSSAQSDQGETVGEVAMGEIPDASVIAVPGTPTSIVADSEHGGLEDMEAEEEEEGQPPPSVHGGGKRRRPDAGGSDLPAESGEGSPGRASDETRVVTCGDLRAMLGAHMREIKEAWGVVQGRVETLEKQARDQKKELKAVHVKHQALDRKVQSVQAKGDACSRKTDQLEGEVQQLKGKVEELVDKIEKKDAQVHPPTDPWAEYLQNKGDKRGGEAKHGQGEKVGLSEEDQRTLIVGGWLPDTRRAKIEEEAKEVLDRDEIRDLIDTDKLVIFGPRRSFGLLRFKLREGETPQSLKQRMWDVIGKVRGGKFVLASTKGEGDGKTMWSSFLKTPEARKRSAMCSLARRVTMHLAAIASKQAEVCNEEALNPEGYDMDWGTGTVWNGDKKIASATHRRDVNRPEDFFDLHQGWVDIRAVTELTKVAWEEAVAAFTREL